MLSPKSKSITNRFILLIFISLLLRLYFSILIYSGDLNNHFGWGESLIDLGPRGMYEREYAGIMKPTYPPLALYAFSTSSLAFRGVYQFAWTLNNRLPIFPSSFIWLLEDQDVMPAFQKIIAIISDIGIGVIIYSFARHLLPRRRLFAFSISALYLLNPAVWYVSSLWGQLESFPLFFLILSYWFIFRRRPLFSLLALSAALLSKQSSIIFVPLYLLYFFSKFPFSILLKNLPLQLIFFYLAYLPFFPIGHASPFWPFLVYLDRLQHGSGSDFISDHAFNFWALFTQLKKISDSSLAIFGLSYATIGFLIFATCLLIALSKQVLKNRLSTLFIATAFISFSSFLFLTKMHERYLAPVLPFLLLASISNRYYLIPFFFISVIHLLNLYHLWWFPGIIPLVSWLSLWSNIQLLISVLLANWLALFYLFVRNPDEK